MKAFELHPSHFQLPQVGVPELESGTSSLSATRSNQLSYTPSSCSPMRRSLAYARQASELRGRSLEGGKCTESRFAVKGNNPPVSVGIDISWRQLERGRFAVIGWPNLQRRFTGLSPAFPRPFSGPLFRGETKSAFPPKTVVGKNTRGRPRLLSLFYSNTTQIGP